MTQRGATLLELMVATVVLTTLATVAIPALGRTLANQQMTAASNGVVGLIHQGRAHGLSTGGAYLCDGERGCDEFGWTGSLVLMDADDEGATITRLRLPQGVQVTWKGFRGQSLHYGPRGNTLFQNGHLLLCHRRHQVMPRKIVVNWIGKPRTEVADPAGCETP